MTAISEPIQRVIDAIDADPAAEWSVPVMSRLAGYSTVHFSRLFATEVGQTPGNYLARARVEKAKGLLKTTGMKVGDIATACGYGSIGAFGNRFAREVGLSPLQFRRAGWSR